MPNKSMVLPRSGPAVLLFALLIFGVLLSALLLSLHFSVAKSDEIAALRQSDDLHRALSAVMDDVPQAQQGVAEWDLLIEELAKPVPDQKWLDSNVGSWLHRLFAHDLIFILGPNDDYIYGNISGQIATALDYSSYQADVSRFIGLTRGLVQKANNDHERLPGQPPAENASVRTTAEAIHATDLAVIAQRPAVVSVMRIARQGSTEAPDMATPHNLLVSIRYIDGLFLQKFSRDNSIKELHYHSVRSYHDDSSERETAVTSSTGTRLGYFMWRPDLPGSDLWRSIFPAVASLIVGAAAVVAIFAFRTYQLLRKRDAHMREMRIAHMQLKASEAHAQHLAFHDTLTGLPNRAFFAACVDQALVRSQSNSECALLLLDLDNFKQVNDTWGHAAGDALIQEFASRAKMCLPAMSTIARLGGDEFAVLMEDSTEDDIIATIEQILMAVQTPFSLLGSRAFVGVSIGVSVAPRNAASRSELLRKADIALYAAKDYGRCRYCFFTEDMDETRKAKAAIEQDLRQALECGQLQVYYQPQVHSATQQLIGVEALLRWQHPTRGAISPQIFVPVAESSGLIVEIGRWVLNEACRAALQWPGLSIAVNLSPVQFRGEAFAAKVIELVHNAGVSPSQIEFEITEGVFIEDDGRVQSAIAELRQAGFRIALDDFGTGYSSLSYLQKFEVDKIKIDRSFVSNIGVRGDSSAIISAVVTLGRSIGLTVNAEGVETAAQRDFLQVAGCDEFQGFLFSRAVSEEEITSRLQMSSRLVASPIAN